MSGKTNSDGEVMYRDLEKGVYLFVQTQKTQISNQVYQSEPFIITVPGNYGGKSIFLADAITDPADYGSSAYWKHTCDDQQENYAGDNKEIL